MTLDDIPTVVSIDRMSFATPWRASSYLHELRHNPQSAYYVLLRPASSETALPAYLRWFRWLRDIITPQTENRIIGYVGFRFQMAEVHISTIAVHPDWRGKGLGELLLLTALEKALERGGKLVSLEVRPSNLVAQRLYHKYGFHFAGVKYGYYRDGENAWLMKTDITSETYRAQLKALHQELITTLHTPIRCEVGQNEVDTI